MPDTPKPVGKRRPIHALYLDTEMLRRSRWPNYSLSLRNLLALAYRSGIRVVIPDAVVREHRAQFLREFAEATRRLATALNSVSELYTRVGLPESERPLVHGAEEVSGAYDRYSELMKSLDGIRPLPFPQRPVDYYFDALLKRQPPFDEKGRGLGDAIIVESALEDLLTVPGKRGLLVTADSDFSAIDKIAASRGVELDAVDLNVAYDEVLEEYSENAVAEFHQKTRLLVRQLLTSSGFPDFLRANLSVPLSALGADSPERVLALERISDIGSEILLATQPPLWDNIAPGTEITVVASVQIELSVLIERPGDPAARWIRLGETLESGHVESPPKPRIEQRKVRTNVDLHAKVTATHEGYGNVVLLGLSMTQ